MKTWISLISAADAPEDMAEITRKFVTRLEKSQAETLPRSCRPPERLASLGELRTYASRLVSFHSKEANTAAVYWIAAYFATAAVRLAEILQDTPPLM